MTDANLQALARAAVEDPAQEAELLRAKLRAGEITLDSLGLAAVQGNNAAQLAMGDPWEWVSQLCERASDLADNLLYYLRHDDNCRELGLCDCDLVNRWCEVEEFQEYAVNFSRDPLKERVEWTID